MALVLYRGHKRESESPAMNITNENGMYITTPLSTSAMDAGVANSPAAFLTGEISAAHRMLATLMNKDWTARSFPQQILMCSRENAEDEVVPRGLTVFPRRSWRGATPRCLEWKGSSGRSRLDISLDGIHPGP